MAQIEVEKIVVLVKLADGTVRQVSAKNEIKQLALKILTSETGSLQVSEPLTDIVIPNN